MNVRKQLARPIPVAPAKKGPKRADVVVELDTCASRSIDPARVADVRTRLVSAATAESIAELFRLLSDPTRVRLLYALLEAGELCVCDLAAASGTPESATSHALRLLRTAGVVRNRRSGRVVYYRLDDAHVRMLLDVTGAHLAHTDDGKP